MLYYHLNRVYNFTLVLDSENFWVNFYLKLVILWCSFHWIIMVFDPVIVQMSFCSIFGLVQHKGRSHEERNKVSIKGFIRP